MYRQKKMTGFTPCWSIDQCAYFAEADEVNSSAAGEKQLNDLIRKRKIGLIQSFDPG